MKYSRKPALFLEKVYRRYHRTEYLGSDPLAVVHQLRTAEDREIGALYAALLAYGNVKQINASLRKLFEAMDGQPAAFVHDFSYRSARERLGPFKHRFTDAEDVLCLAHLIHQRTRSRPLQRWFADCVQSCDEDFAPAAGRFIGLLLSGDFGRHFDERRMLAKASFKHFVPRPERGSACKRLYLFLRWMIRERDGIDLGLWESIEPDKLLIPVDTHILRISNKLGFTSKQTASLAAAREITSVLRRVDPADPVRFDFSLCRLGILKQCPSTSSLDTCRECALEPICTFPEQQASE